MKSLVVVAALAALVGLRAAQAAPSFVGSQTDSDTWSYTLNLGGDYNFSYDTSPVLTITLTGVTGVTSATIPNATTAFASPDFINDYILFGWSVDVLDGGTKVVWTKSDRGTGNNGDFSISGFSIDAPGSVNGTVSYATIGMIEDVVPPVNVDVSGTTDGPVGDDGGGNIPEPASLGILGLGGAALLLRRRR